jgi:hypothetical protein
MKQYTCDECGECFTIQTTFSNLRKIRLEGKPSECERCRKDF